MCMYTHMIYLSFILMAIFQFADCDGLVIFRVQLLIYQGVILLG